MPNGFYNGVLAADNVDFTGNANVAAQVTTNGQLLIGSTASPNIRVGTLTAGTGISITNGAGAITIASTGSTTDLHDSRYIVSAGGTADGANYTTIASAITAASAAGGVQTVFIQPGTYTENLTMASGVNLCAHTCDGFSVSTIDSNVTIKGKITASYTGNCSISGIRLETNADFCVVQSGANACRLYLVNCCIQVQDNTAISLTNSNNTSKFHMYYCSGDVATTGITYFTASQTGEFKIFGCYFLNNGGTTTASSTSGAGTDIRQTSLAVPFTTSVGVTNITYSTFASLITSGSGGFAGDYINGGTLTTVGTGSTNLSHSFFDGDASSAVSIGTGTTVKLTNSTVNSSNTNAITGLGTLQYSTIAFTGSSNLINTTTQTANYTNLGKWKASGQPAFLAYLASSALNKTGAGTAYTIGTDALTEVFDQNSDFNTNGTFTAPVTGKYQVDCKINVTGLTAAMTNDTFNLVTSNRTYSGTKLSLGVVLDSNTTASLEISVLADMDAADTFTCVVTVSNGAGDTADIQGSATVLTYMSGCLIC